MLYHVSFDEIPKDTLVPRIPENRADDEDKSIKRICFSTSIENAISAMPNGGKALKNLLYIKDELRVEPILHLYTINEESLPTENVVCSADVSKYVPDALHTGETWVINQPVKCDHEIVIVTSADIREGHDCNGKKLCQVDRIEWQQVDKLPRNAPENLFKDCGHSVRTILACVDWGARIRERRMAQ